MPWTLALVWPFAQRKALPRQLAARPNPVARGSKGPARLPLSPLLPIASKIFLAKSSCLSGWTLLGAPGKGVSRGAPRESLSEPLKTPSEKSAERPRQSGASDWRGESLSTLAIKSAKVLGLH